jgi:hypothetical protein
MGTTEVGTLTVVSLSARNIARVRMKLVRKFTVRFLMHLTKSVSCAVRKNPKISISNLRPCSIHYFAFSQKALGSLPI